MVFTAFLASLAVAGAFFYRSSTNYLIVQPTVKAPIDEAKEKEFRIFTGEQLRDLYNNFRYTNTDKIIEPPSITGDVVADAKIRELAESRGYRMRRLARSTTGKADERPLQLIAQKSWLDLKAEAAQGGVVLTVTSAFRSVGDQRTIFLQGLEAYGISAQDIAGGQADSLVDKVLQTYAPPGYSRHHTGFTIDLTCGTNGLTNFVTTICYEWLSRDNHQRAKTFGWVPSYPEGADLQGPEPEPWEYIWVTVDALLK